MMPVYVLDACAMLAVLSKEPGADKITRLIELAETGEIHLVMNIINLLEVYYTLLRRYGKYRSDLFYQEVMSSEYLISIVRNICDDIVTEAARLKTTCKMSLGDCIALAQASTLGGVIVTADHHEFDMVEKSEQIDFYWIR